MVLTLEQQVSSLESSKSLRELGCPQDTHFYWMTVNHNTEPGFHWELLDREHPLYRKNSDFCISSYTVADLGEMLPFYLVGIGELVCIKNHIRDRKTGWNVGYNKTVNGGKETPRLCANIEAEARAKLLIHLLENGLMTLK